MNNDAQIKKDQEFIKKQNPNVEFVGNSALILADKWYMGIRESELWESGFLSQN